MATTTGTRLVSTLSYIATASDATVAVVNSQLGTVWVKVNYYDDTPNWTMVPGVVNATRVAIVNQSSLLLSHGRWLYPSVR